jgi:hypothetical protein
MERLFSLIKKYNIGVDTLLDFLFNNGYEGNLSLTTKIDNQFSDLIDKEFYSDFQIKKLADTIEMPETENDRLYKEIKILRPNQTKRIPVDAGRQITYRNLFGACFWGCKEIHCIDPYIREDNQFQNVKQLITLIKEFTLNTITFNLTTCYDSKIDQSKNHIQKKLNEIKIDFPEEILNFAAMEDKHYHDRHIYVDNKYIIDLTRGLDIFNNYHNQNNSISKNFTVFITRIS